MIVPYPASKTQSAKKTNLWTVLKRTAGSWQQHNAFRLSASMAFYTILSLAPLVILVISIVALVFGHSSAQDRIVAQVRDTVGKVGADAVGEMLKHPPRPKSGLLASAVGILTLLFGASGVFGELRDSLNTMWDVKPKSANEVITFVKERAIMFGMVLAVGFLLLVSLVISTATAALGKYFTQFLPAPEFVLHVVSSLISLAGITVLFALIFKYVPDMHVDWEDVWVGAFVTSLLFTLGKVLIGLYLGKAAVGSSYGAAGSVIAVTVWVYYSSLIFFFGAEFTHEYACLTNPAHAGREKQTPRHV
jgi:membrane protein